MPTTFFDSEKLSIQYFFSGETWIVSNTSNHLYLPADLRCTWVACGSYHAFAVCEGQLYSWGRTEGGQLGLASEVIESHIEAGWCWGFREGWMEFESFGWKEPASWSWQESSRWSRCQDAFALLGVPTFSTTTELCVSNWIFIHVHKCFNEWCVGLWWSPIFFRCLPSGHITWWFQELQLDDSCVCLPHEVKGLPPISSAAGGDVHSLALDETGAGPEGGEMEVEAKHK